MQHGGLIITCRRLEICRGIEISIHKLSMLHPQWIVLSSSALHYVCPVVDLDRSVPCADSEPPPQAVAEHVCDSVCPLWAASCPSEDPASSRCWLCHLQMSGRARGAEERREEMGVKMKERKQNNWFCRHLERVQAGQQEPQSANGAQGIPTFSENVSSLFSFGWAKRFFCKMNENKERRCIVQKCLQGCFSVGRFCRLFVIIIIITRTSVRTSLWVSLVRIALNCALREKCIQERIIWLIKYMNKRSHMPNIFFFLHCSQLASNCGIKGLFVLHSLYNLDGVLGHCHGAWCHRKAAVVCLGLLLKAVLTPFTSLFL